MRIIADELNMNVFIFSKHYPTPPKTGTADGATDATGDAESDGDGAKGTETGREGESAQSAKKRPTEEEPKRGRSDAWRRERGQKRPEIK